VIASGGIASADDVRALRALEPAGVSGAIIGKALYDGRLTLEAALAAGRS
jgi:phosphoribosylformimino-5-aminoimidazole carboxamide ribonucleotide (ProFAR) isomerase